MLIYPPILLEFLSREIFDWRENNFVEGSNVFTNLEEVISYF